MLLPPGLSASSSPPPAPTVKSQLLSHSDPKERLLLQPHGVGKAPAAMAPHHLLLQACISKNNHQPGEIKPLGHKIFQ